MTFFSKYLRSLLILFLLVFSVIPDNAWPASTVSSRIVGGEDTSTDDWPWVTALVYRNVQSSYDGQFCGGSLIHPRWVLTAAHCFLDRHDEIDTAIEVDAVIGRTDLTSNDGKRIAVNRILANPDYNPAADDGDIVLLELAEAVEGVETVGLPGPIYDQFFATAGMTSTAIGWGSTSGTASIYPEILQEVSMPLVSNEVCQETYPSHLITDNMVCAGDGLGGRDSCQGDSGGPLVIDQGNGPVLVGIVSFGEGCALPDTYGVYTRVSRYVQLISDVICADSELPSAPTISVNVVGNDVGLSFNAVTNATGYRLYYAPASTLSPISQIDVGLQTSLNVTLPSGSDFYVAVQPYNGACLGGLSPVTRILIP